jgi:hypothetical protein
MGTWHGATYLKPSRLGDVQPRLKMSMKDIVPEIERLGAHLDNLEDLLEPIWQSGNLSASQLPLLDKAKLFALTGYAINALLHCKSSMDISP